MFAKILSFFTSFFTNVKADPVSSAKGVVQLASAGAVGYGMATGIVPINVGAPMAASFAASGIHALGTNSATGVEAPAAVKAEAAIDLAAALTPSVLSVVDQINAIKAQADEGQQKVDAYQTVLAVLTAAAPPTRPTHVGP